MPQVVLQSVFILRISSATNDVTSLRSIGIVIASLIASILSIANKYSWFDEQAVVWDAKEINIDKKKCYISWRWCLRVLWR